MRLFEIETKYFYHVTPTKNITNIMKNGLIPSIGSSSSKFGEEKPATFMFRNKDDMEDALSNWLGDEFGEDEKLSLLQISLPNNMHIFSDVGFEVYVLETIPSNNIKVITKNL